MRILVTAQADSSHLRPILLPYARAAAEAGHRVAVATSPDLAPGVDLPGVEVLVLPDAEPLGTVMGRLAAGPTTRGGTSAERFARGFVSTLGPVTAEALLRSSAGRSFDLVVREVTEFGGHLAAGVLGVPTRVVDIGPMSQVAQPEVLAALDVERARFGLPALRPGEVWGAGRVGVLPESFYPPARRVPGASHAQVPWPRHARPVSGAVAELPGDRPLVLVSLGSQVTRLPGARELLGVIVDALARLPVAAVVAVGTGGERPAAPAHVVVEPVLAQRELLGAADLFITHAGFNSVREALAEGTPLVCLPFFGDQPGNAARVEELGLGRVLDPATADADLIADAVRSTLADPSVAARARELQRRTLALPPMVDLVSPPAGPAPAAPPGSGRRGA